MRPLTDLEVLALLAAAPVDAHASGGNGVRAGHVTPWESHDARDFLAAMPPAEARAILARVFDLSPREADEPIVIMLAWQSEADEAAAREADRKRIDREQSLDSISVVQALDMCGAGDPASSLAKRIKAVCAEVLELRAIRDRAEAVLRADVGPESERPITEAHPDWSALARDLPDDEPTVEVFIDPAELAQAEADRAAAACAATRPADEDS